MMRLALLLLCILLSSVSLDATSVDSSSSSALSAFAAHNTKPAQPRVPTIKTKKSGKPTSTSAASAPATKKSGKPTSASAASAPASKKSGKPTSASAASSPATKKSRKATAASATSAATAKPGAKGGKNGKKREIPGSSKAAAAAAATPADGKPPTDDVIQAAFAQQQAKYKRKYKTPSEKTRRYNNFKRRYLRAFARNAASNARRAAKGKPPRSTPVFDAVNNPLGDLDDDKFAKQFLGGKPKKAPANIRVGRPRPRASTARFVQRQMTRRSDARLLEMSMEQGPLKVPKTSDITPPADIGDNKGKRVVGGDNKGKKVVGGENKGKKIVGGNHGDQATIGDTIQADVMNVGWRKRPSQMFGFKGPNIIMKYDLSSEMFPPVIRNQGECRSCWATTAVEHYQAVLSVQALLPFDGNGLCTRLSVQQVIDCSRSDMDKGCNGGTVLGAFDFITKNGIVSAGNYQYPQDGTQHECGKTFFNTKGHAYVAPNSKPELFRAKDSLFLVPPCLTGSCPPNLAYEKTLLGFWENPPPTFRLANNKAMIPVVAYVDATKWDDYKGGIYPAADCSSAGTALSHIVQIVGFGTDKAAGQDFWLIRNSWGDDWGEGGHIRLPFGQNACGLFNYVIYLDASRELAQDSTTRKTMELQKMINESPRVKEQLKMQEMMNNSPQAKKMKEMQDMMNNSPQVKKMQDLQNQINNSPRMQNPFNFATPRSS